MLVFSVNDKLFFCPCQWQLDLTWGLLESNEKHFENDNDKYWQINMPGTSLRGCVFTVRKTFHQSWEIVLLLEDLGYLAQVPLDDCRLKSWCQLKHAERLNRFEAGPFCLQGLLRQGDPLGHPAETSSYHLWGQCAITSQGSKVLANSNHSFFS